MDSGKIKTVKEELERLILEAFFLGVTTDELIQLVEKMNASKRGGENVD